MTHFSHSLVQDQETSILLFLSPLHCKKENLSTTHHLKPALEAPLLRLLQIRIIDACLLGLLLLVSAADLPSSTKQQSDCFPNLALIDGLIDSPIMHNKWVITNCTKLPPGIKAVLRVHNWMFSQKKRKCPVHINKIQLS
jgi:hypothetical protein